jgi:uncharacterized cupin superfamily protein
MKKLFCGLLLLTCLVGCSGQSPVALANGDAGRIVRFTDDGLTPFSYGPLFARVDVIEGNPEFKVTRVDKTGDVRSGFWESTEGKWHFTTADDHWEYCHIVEGVSEITEDGGKPQRFVAGQSFILHPGFSGVWHAIEATKKEFVIVNPQSNGK